MKGFVKVASAIPKVKVADCRYNIVEINRLIQEAATSDVQIIVFPELSITGYSCGDLFFQQVLQEDALLGMLEIAERTAHLDIISIVGLPIVIGHQLLNTAAVIQRGHILGLVPKSYLPNYKEFYEQRWFTSAFDNQISEYDIHGEHIPVGNDLLFSTREVTFGIEICEDLWAPIPPSSYLATQGAEILFNLSASDECVGKHKYLRNMISQQSGRLIAGYVYSSCGFGESSTDVVFSGNAFICENGNFLCEANRFNYEPQLLIGDIDVDCLRNERLTNTTFKACRNHITQSSLRMIMAKPLTKIGKLLHRTISPHPFIPKGRDYEETCHEIISIQCAGLAKRLTHTHARSAVIGISGGLDSTLALLICVRTFDQLGKDRKDILAITMPGFGTTDRTYLNAVNLIKELGCSFKEIDIKEACRVHFKDIEHTEELHNAVYENTQARERTQILMDIANQYNGIVIGTGDLSEIALGWSTYNGDHMSMYGVNSGVPKTLVKYLVQWIADNKTDSALRTILLDIISTPVSPELLPSGENEEIEQRTEDVVGPYELHDFFLYHFMRYGATPRKILYLATIAFADSYDESIIKYWLSIFTRRFFAQQFKRSCMPDGPKVGSVSLSPRGDWRMPSDASCKLWLDKI
ncbi:MAG: NAD(+) synthase [Bacteroidaceae bacterium]|nr:NAD(+) synthase [Bacteroidaceae bacterium]